MPGAIVVFVVWVLVVGTASVVALWYVRTQRSYRRCDSIRESELTIATSITRPGMALALYLAGFASIVILCWPLGLLAHQLEHAIDWPIFRWFQARQIGSWSDLWWVLTNIGMPRLTQAVSAAGGIFFAIVWKLSGRRWWVPLAIFSTGYALEKYIQIILQTVVHRGHPPTTLGTYPSGGCARVIIVYGLIVTALLIWRWPGNKFGRTVGAVVVAGVWTVQAYARLYNLEHWTTDIVGGTIFGGLGLAVMATCFRILTPPLDQPPVAGIQAGGSDAQRRPQKTA